MMTSFCSDEILGILSKNMKGASQSVKNEEISPESHRFLSSSAFLFADKSIKKHQAADSHIENNPPSIATISL